MSVSEISRPSSHPSSRRTSSSPILAPRRKSKRKATVYDAVAGRISSTGFLPSSPLPSLNPNRDTTSSTTVPNPPEEVLFRRPGAPDRYEEDDFYWADRNLAPGIELPDSDLLKAVHAYAAGFYARTGGAADFRSLDETALLAVGVLLEEWADMVLGKTGHEVFLEGKKRKADEDKADKEKEKEEVEAAARKSRKRQRRKRRKVIHESGEGSIDG